MRIALPLQDGSLHSHFGDAKEFALYDVHDQTKAVTPLGTRTFSDADLTAHGGGCQALPPLLKNLEVELVLVHDIGKPALNDLLLHGILAVTETPLEEPALIIEKLVTGRLLAQHPTCVIPGSDTRGTPCSNCSHHH